MTENRAITAEPSTNGTSLPSAKPVVSGSWPISPQWVTAIVAVLGTLGTLVMAYLSLSNSIGAVSRSIEVQREKHDGQVTTIENVLNRHADDIEKIRQRGSATETTIANNAGAGNLTNGRFETLLNSHSNDLSAIKPDVANLGKAMAAMEAKVCRATSDVGQIKNTEIEKLRAEFQAIRDRLTALESLAKQKN